MKIQSKLVLVFGAMTLAVSVLFSAIAFWRLEQNAGRNAANINALIRANLERQIWEKARDIAGQVEIYLADHPFDPRDGKLRLIAVQPVLKTGYSGLHDGVGSSDGRYVFHANPAVQGKALSGFKTRLPDLWRAITNNLRGEETSAYYLWEDPPGTFREKFFVGVPVRNSPCILFATVYVDEFYGPLRNAEDSIRRELLLALHLLFFSALAAAGAMVLASILVARRITGPIRRLSSAARLAGRGELARAIPVESADEVGELAEILNGMMKDIAAYVKNLKETMSLKERMEGELNAAHNIQQSILPHAYPLFPEITEFDVHAVMVPAREVGGDFYDIFFVEPRRVAFVIGDVSGKGVPSALFMAITRTLIRLLAMDRAGASEILRRASHFLSLENEAQMFVTVLYGEYDLNTGETVLANAGHCRPLLIRGGSPEAVPLQANIPLGVGIPHQYPSVTLKLGRGDIVLLYTDGVTEAQSPRGEFYGLDNLLAAVRRAGAAGNPKELCGAVQKGLEQFGRGCELADDFTLLALQARPL